jgi:hypothetical protein
VTAYRGFDGSVIGSADGGGGLIHKGRGQSSNRSLCDGVRGYLLELLKTKYAGLRPDADDRNPARQA